MPISVRLIHHFFSYSTTDPLNTHQSPPSVNRHPFWTQNLITFPVNPISKLQVQDQNRESGIKLIPPSINFCTFAFLYIFRVEIGSCCWELAKFNLNKTAPFKSPSHPSAAAAVPQQASLECSFHFQLTKWRNNSHEIHSGRGEKTSFSVQHLVSLLYSVDHDAITHGSIHAPTSDDFGCPPIKVVSSGNRLRSMAMTRSRRRWTGTVVVVNNKPKVMPGKCISRRRPTNNFIVSQPFI